MIIVPFLLVVLNIAIIGLILNIPSILLFPLFPSRIFLNIIALKVIPQRRVLLKGYSLKFPIGVEAEDHDEQIVGKADDRDCVDVLFSSCVGIGADLILNWGEEVDHKGDHEEDAHEDEDHEALVVALVLDHVEDEQEEEAE